MKRGKWIGEQCSETEETLRKNSSKRTYQLVKDLTTVKHGRLLLSKIVQENASQKNDRYWTDGQNTSLHCTITRPMEIHQYWTVPRQTADDYPILRKEVEAAVQLLKKGK